MRTAMVLLNEIMHNIEILSKKIAFFGIVLAAFQWWATGTSRAAHCPLSVVINDYALLI